MARVKRSDKNRAAKSKELSDHVIGETEVVEKDGLDEGKDLQWKLKEGEIHSDTKLEDDLGAGPAAIIRAFDFKANPEAFKARTPSKQELFNAHAKQIEWHLYQDGLQVMYEVKPRLVMEKKNRGYRIIVAAEPRKGFLLNERPQTLTQLINESRKD